MNIILTINPDPDGVRCGECVLTVGEDDGGFCEWSIAHPPGSYRDYRGPECLAAERKLREIVLAGEDMRDSLEGDETSGNGERRAAWDHALDAVDAEVEKR